MRHAFAGRSSALGYTYLMLLWWVALSGVMLAALSRSWTMESRREREAELVYRGEQIKAALQSYEDASPPEAKALPTDLAQLLEDKRGPVVLRHLRRLYKDPLMPDGQWALLKEGDFIKGVYSRSTQRPIKSLDEQATYQDWRFEVMLPTPADAPASNASPASGASPAASSPIASSPFAPRASLH